MTAVSISPEAAVRPVRRRLRGTVDAEYTYSSGRLVSASIGGVARSITYNADGTVDTITEGGETVQIQYSGGRVVGRIVL